MVVRRPLRERTSEYDIESLLITAPNGVEVPLREVAEVINMHESTVSRVTNQKYVQTPRGVFPLKFFFSSGLGTAAGEDISSKAAKEKIIRLVEGEDKKKPLTDAKLMELLKEKGYNIARRTVAKYREQLNIPVARLRKEL